MTAVTTQVPTVHLPYGPVVDDDRRGMSFYSQQYGERVIKLHVSHSRNSKAYRLWALVLKREEGIHFTSEQFMMCGAKQFQRSLLAVPRFSKPTLIAVGKRVENVFAELLGEVAFDITTQEGVERFVDILHQRIAAEFTYA